MSPVVSLSRRRASSPGVANGRKMSILPKSNVNIHVDHHFHNKTYTTSSKVSGHVIINPTNDVRFDYVQVLFVGISKTRMDAVNIPQATSHTFLKLSMPMSQSTYPNPRVYEAGRTYKIPFTFVIPSHLTLSACSHSVGNELLRDHHTRLPPSIGSWDKDDLSPHMSRVTYNVKVKVMRVEEPDKKSSRVMEAAQEILVLPATPEEPPLSVARQDKLYSMSKVKSLRRTILSPKTGKLTLTATQPGAALMKPDGQSIAPTSTQVDLKFEPSSSESQPPKVTGVSSKVTAVTYFSAGGINQFPNLRDWSKSYGAEGRGHYSTSTPVACTAQLSDKSVTWRQHLTSRARRDSGYCSETAPSDSEPLADENNSTAFRLPGVTSGRRSKAPPYYYRAAIPVTIQLPPNKKQYIPTFHSCITSRVYVLNLTVSLSAPGGISSNVTLNIPLQISVDTLDRSVDGGVNPPSFEAAMEEDAQVDEFLRPRTLSVPDVQFQNTAILPGYEDIAGRRRSVAFVH